MSDNIQNPLYVIGHKNPDTDAICAAIGQAAYLELEGNSNVEAICCGEIPERTQWVLDQAGIEAPRLVTDVRIMVEDLICQEGLYLCQNSTLLTAYDTMIKANVRSIPIVSEDGDIEGILRLADLLQLMVPSQTQGIHVKTVYTTLKNATCVLDGTSVGADLPDSDEEEELILFVAASSLETVEKRLNIADNAGTGRVAICGDRPDVHEFLINYGVRSLIISANFTVTDELIAKAKQNGTTIIYSKHDTATTVQLIRCSRCVKGALTKDFVALEEGQAISDIKDQLGDSNQDVFPVLFKGSKKFIGAFAKSELISIPRKRLVLVDHNEFAQAVQGVEEAQIVEVIDHHRLAGDICTQEPITYLNELVGSTSTLIARKFRYRNTPPSKGVALCLLAGLISDTLNLTSPTTTDLDKEILQWLCEIAEVKADEFTKSFFEAGSLLLHGTAEDIVGVDRKEFKENGRFVSISQIEEILTDSLPTRMDEIRASLQDLVEKNGYDLAIIAVTEITSHTSTILHAGNTNIVNALPYEQVAPGIWTAPGVVSRKKQIFPAMCEAIEKSWGA
ncbi:putative manganese-dependent inorganic diphosphatase [Akkermansiaceae bacterium]|nr:putative manganese-dependent inorganic diphosphatase [Akkermansiaceae bacterium]